MGDRKAFLDAIRAQPGDDVCRLVYADWLEEHGDCDRDRATAEFIRLSCDRSGKRRMGDGAYRWLLDVEMVPLPEVPGETAEERFVRSALSGTQWRTLSANWKRLVPNLLSWHQGQWKARPGEWTTPLTARRKGRFVTVQGRFGFPGRDYHLHRLTLEFSRGFLVDFTLGYYSMLPDASASILYDQPLCERAAKAVGPELAEKVARIRGDV